MQIVRYTASYKSQWDDFVRGAKNATFLFLRDYMEYHADRFVDASFLFFEQEKMVALLPACIDEKEATLYSHKGLTYGGLILSNKSSTPQVLHLWETFLQQIATDGGIKKVIYKPIPHIYHLQPAEEDLYALFRSNAQLSARAVSSVIELDRLLTPQMLRKRGAKKANRLGVTLHQVEDCTAFWQVLSDTLEQKYATKPVHSLPEMKRLHHSFPEEIQFFEARYLNEVVGGCVVYVSQQVAHMQYIAASAQGKSMGALDALFLYLIEVQYKEMRYIDFGTSVEQGGAYLNEGLIFQKEGFGARAVVYDTYEIKLG